MTTLGRKWAGQIYGTNTGKLFLEVDGDPKALTGTLRINDDRFGIGVYAVAATFDGGELKVNARPAQAEPGVTLTSVTAVGQLTPEGHIRGDWQAAAGTAGTFVLFPHDAPAAAAASSAGAVAEAERVQTSARTVGSVRLYASDVAELIRVFGQDFAAARVVVTYRAVGETEVTRYAEDCLAQMPKVKRLRMLRLWAQEPDIGGVQRNAMIELNESGNNVVRVQGVQESWVLGKTEALAAQLKLHEKFFVTSVRRFGLNFNGLLFMLMLAFLPELALQPRIVFMATIIGIVLVIAYLHGRLIPNAAIYLSPTPPTLAELAWPQVASGLIALIATFLATVAYGLLKGELGLPDWLARLLH